ncbi:MAG TPA: hypothetical protein VFZ53_17610 [Polyangiaceae bacterium]
MVARRKEVLSLAAALGLHALALLALGTLLRERTSDAAPVAPARSPLEAAFDIDIDIGVAEPFAAGPPRGGAEALGATRDERLARNEMGARSRFVSPEAPAGAGPSELDEPSASGEPELAAPPEPGISEEGTANRPLDLGIGPDGWQRWAAPPKAGERAPAGPSKPRSHRFQVYRPPPVSTTGGLQEGLEKRDRELGLGPQGRVLSAMHNAAHQTVAPQVGVARFDVTVNRSGLVEVTLGSASGEVEGWKKVAKRIADDLRASPPPITAPRQGVRLVVELVAEETMPNGVRITSLEKPHLEVTAPKLQSVERSLEDLEKDNPTADDPRGTLPPIKLDLPGVYLAERGKVCSYRLGVSALGPVFQGGCDPSNIGAKPQRMVRARVLEQTMF